jgi:hypothetical protein
MRERVEMSKHTRTFSKVDRFLWRDTRFLELSDDAKILWIYLLTSPQSTCCPGLFVSPPLTVIDDLGWAFKNEDLTISEGKALAFAGACKRLKEALDELQSLLWVDFDARHKVIFIPKAIKHNMPESPKVAMSWATALKSIPDCELKTKWIQVAVQTLVNKEQNGMLAAFASKFKEVEGKALGKGQSKRLSKGVTKALTLSGARAYQDQEQEQEQEQEEIHPLTPEPVSGFALSATAEKPKRGTECHPDAHRLAEYLLEQILVSKPDLKVPTDSAFKGWVREMDHIVRLDHRNPDRVAEVIHFATRDESFWSGVILSAKSLRRGFDRIEKKMAAVEKNPTRTLEPRVDYPDLAVVGKAEGWYRETTTKKLSITGENC